MQAVVVALDRLDLRLQMDRVVALGDPLLQRPHQVGVASGQQLVEHLDDRDPRAERVVNRRHLEADDPAADHEQAAGHAVELERAGGGDDPAVVGDVRQRRGLRAARDDAVVEA